MSEKIINCFLALMNGHRLKGWNVRQNFQIWATSPYPSTTSDNHSNSWVEGGDWPKHIRSYYSVFLLPSPWSVVQGMGM